METQNRRMMELGELYRRLKDYSKTDYYPYHMPGHKRLTVAVLQGSEGKRHSAIYASMGRDLSEFI